MKGRCCPIFYRNIYFLLELIFGFKFAETLVAVDRINCLLITKILLSSTNSVFRLLDFILFFLG